MQLKNKVTCKGCDKVFTPLAIFPNTKVCSTTCLAAFAEKIGWTMERIIKYYLT